MGCVGAGQVRRPDHPASACEAFMVRHLGWRARSALPCHGRRCGGEPATTVGSLHFAQGAERTECVVMEEIATSNRR